MKKRSKLILAIFLLLTPAVLYFALHEEYGDSYREQHRELFNTYIKDHYGFNSIDWNPKKNRSGSTSHKELKKQTKHLADLHQPEWEAPLNISPNLDQLPIEGLTTWELAELGKKTNDPNIYLLLAEIRENTNIPRHGNDDSPVYYALCKKWLRKAIDLKRPGADFLLAAADASAKANTYVEENNDAGYIMNIPGYDEFAKLVLAGDYRLFRTLLSIEPYIFLTPLGSQFESQLKQSAEAGNIEAQRQLGEIGFLFYRIFTDYADRLLDKEVGVFYLNKQRSKFKLWLEDQEYVSFRAGTTPSRKKMIQYARYLEQAAEAGDLQAMNLWMLEGSRYVTEYGKKQWESVFRYKNALIQAGYADFIHQLFSQRNSWNMSVADYLPYYYDENEITKIQPGYFKHLFQRNDSIQCSFGLCCEFMSGGKNLPAKTALSMLEAWREIRPFQINSWFIRRYSGNAKIKALVINTLESNAAAGHIESLLELGELYREGQYVKKDLSKSVNYYEQAWNILKGQAGLSNLYGEETLPELLRWVPWLLEFYLGTDSGFYDRNKAIQFVHDFESFISRYQEFYSQYPEESDTQSCIMLVKGIKYDQGLGVPQNPEKAQQIYNQIFKFEGWRESYIPDILKKINSCYKPQQSDQTP